MPSWFVFEPAKTAPDTLEAADKSVFVKDGFSLGAFLVTPVWLLWRRMWLVFLAWLGLQVALAVLTSTFSLDQRAAGIVSLLVSLCFALEANALRAWTMRRQGWRFTGVASGHTLDEAEQRHFEGRSLVASAAANPPTAGSRPLGQEFPGPWSSALGRNGGSPNVLGVFPEPHGTKP
ncbi:DUF2628 domain-containing protein [Labrys sp. ZIDIC5]|uniref:DUF2628 domain-containing protein n=1 Tax=Labrys sedimenti TaxID=3106036 RepID=UPI002ACAD9E5|nr:DUF2628 domain-containing protein [Labrys sp. ZIDIC5]MDZ5450623.1 DUF2628 domain-containing protein [Labrys sp. ZIDIC5]